MSLCYTDRCRQMADVNEAYCRRCLHAKVRCDAGLLPLALPRGLQGDGGATDLPNSHIPPLGYNSMLGRTEGPGGVGGAPDPAPMAAPNLGQQHWDTTPTDELREACEQAVTDIEQQLGARFNHGKWVPTFWPREALAAASRVWEYGAQKYARDNWKSGMPWTEVADSALRHIHAFLDYQESDHDRESGLHHLWHALCNLAMLCWFIEHRSDMDDRWKGEHVEVGDGDEG